MSGIDHASSLVHSCGADPEESRLIAQYITDRCAGLSLTTLHSSSYSALTHDPFLVNSIGLSRRQIRAWLALIRGTRSVRRGDRVYGGCRGLIEAARSEQMTARERARFERLARVAANG
jgi:hypothetical protein